MHRSIRILVLGRGIMPRGGRPTRGFSWCCFLQIAAKSYKPDFGVPDLPVLVEAKFVGPKTEASSIQEQILADVPGYLSNTTKYDAIVVFVYDGAHKLGDSRKFIEDLKAVEGIVDVIVIPGVG